MTSRLKTYFLVLSFNATVLLADKVLIRGVVGFCVRTLRRFNIYSIFVGFYSQIIDFGKERAHKHAPALD